MFVNPVSGYNVGSFVVGDRGPDLIRISSDDIVSLYMNCSLITGSALLLLQGYPHIMIQNLDILVAVVCVISVYEYIIPAGNGELPDSIAGQNAVLAAVMADEPVTTALLDSMGRIKKQIIPVEF
jgi:hypothetical protein